MKKKKKKKQKTGWSAYQSKLHLILHETFTSLKRGWTFWDNLWIQVKALSPWNVFWNISFSKICWQILYVSLVNWYCTYIFKGSKYRFSSKHFSRTAILTQASVITCEYNFRSFSCICFACFTCTVSFFKD